MSIFLSRHLDCFLFVFRMHIPLALLFLVAAPGCASVSTKRDSIRNTRHNIINIAQITLVHIKKLRTKVCTLLHTSIVYNQSVFRKKREMRVISYFLFGKWGKNFFN